MSVDSVTPFRRLASSAASPGPNSTLVIIILTSALVLADWSFVAAAQDLASAAMELIGDTSFWLFALVIAGFVVWRSVRGEPPLVGSSERVAANAPQRQCLAAAPLSLFGGGFASIFTGVAAYGPIRSESEALQVSIRANALAAPLCALSLFNLWPIYFLSVFSQAAPDMRWSTYVIGLCFQVYSIAVIGLVVASIARVPRRWMIRSPVNGLMRWSGFLVFVVCVCLGMIHRSQGPSEAFFIWVLIGLAIATLIDGYQTPRTRLALGSTIRRSATGILPLLVMLFLIFLLIQLVQDSNFDETPRVGLSLPFPLLTAFLATAFLALLTGSSWAAAGALAPLLLVPSEPVPPALLGAILSGAVLGDHAAPHSDTTIGAAAATGVSPLSVSARQHRIVLFGASLSALIYICLDLVTLFNS